MVTTVLRFSGDESLVIWGPIRWSSSWALIWSKWLKSFELTSWILARIGYAKTAGQILESSEREWASGVRLSRGIKVSVLPRLKWCILHSSVLRTGIKRFSLSLSCYWRKRSSPRSWYASIEKCLTWSFVLLTVFLFLISYYFYYTFICRLERLCFREQELFLCYKEFRTCLEMKVLGALYKCHTISAVPTSLLEYFSEV